MDKDNMKISINLYEKITAEESEKEKSFAVKETLLNLVDDLLQKRLDLTVEQRGQLARLRSHIMIHLETF